MIVGPVTGAVPKGVKGLGGGMESGAGASACRSGRTESRADAEAGRPEGVPKGGFPCQLKNNCCDGRLFFSPSGPPHLQIIPCNHMTRRIEHNI